MFTVTLPNGTVLTQVSRASCLARIRAIPLGSYEYSQSRIEVSTDKRADCTGWLSYVWATPDSGLGIYLHAYNTASFYTQRVIARIGWADLLPGDTIGYFAPTSPGNGGHGAIWMGGDRRPDGTFDVSDHGSGWGPKRRRVKWDGSSTGWLHPDHLAPWRYVGIIETTGDDMITGPDLAAALRWALDPTNATTNPDAKVVQAYLRAIGWQYVGGGIDPGMSTLKVLDAIHQASKRAPADLAARLDAILAAALDDNDPSVVAGPDVLAELVAIRDALSGLVAAALEAIPVEVRDAVADLGEGGAAQVRADT